MNPQDAIDLSQEAIQTCIFVGGPILAASLLIGLVVSLVQSMTQLHDQSIAFVPKILLMLVAIGVCLPWLTDRMLEFTKYSLEKPVVFYTMPNEDSTVDQEDKTASHFNFAWLNSPSSKSDSSQTGSPVPVKPTTPAMPMLRSTKSMTQPQLKLQPSQLQPRVASPFALPTFRSADSEAANQPSDTSADDTKTF